MTVEMDKLNTPGRIWCGPECPDHDRLKSEWKSLGHYFLHKMSTDSANDVIVTDYASGRQYTGLQLKDKVLAVACALIDGYNFEPGTMVCMSYDNSDHLLIVTLAVLVAGGATSCVYAKDPYEELLYLAKKVEPKFLFCHSKNLQWAKKLSDDMGFRVVGIPMDEPSSQSTSVESQSNSNISFTCFSDLISYNYTTMSSSLDKLPVATNEPLDKRLALVTMSSGTTGKPKAVAQSHWSCLVSLYTQRSKMFAFPCTTSFDYISGRVIMFSAIHGSYNVVILNGFEPKTYLEAIEKYKVEFICMGTIYLQNLIMYEHLDQYDISSVRTVYPLGVKLTYLDDFGKFLAKHPHIVEVILGYGGSEANGICEKKRTPEEYLKDCDNTGKLSPGVQVKIVEPNTGRLLGPNELGIVHVKSPAVFIGYYDMELYRRQKVGPLVQDESVFDRDGFYITGDLAYFNDKEELYMVGREKELMCCGARKILPQELEDIIISHPAVLKVCVLGIKHSRISTQHCPRAYVVPKPHYNKMSWEEFMKRPKLKEHLNEHPEKLDHVGEHKLCSVDVAKRRLLAEDLMEFVNERVGFIKQLTGGIVILDDIPCSRDTGKMDKNYLRSLQSSQVEIYGDRSS